MATQVATEVRCHPHEHSRYARAWHSPDASIHDTSNASMMSYNNHESILDITTTTEASEDAALQRSFVSYEDLHTPLNQSVAEEEAEFIESTSTAVVTSSPYSVQQPYNTCATTDTSNPITEWTTRLIDTSSTNLRNVTESFVDSLCPASDSALLEISGCGSLSRVCDPTLSKDQQKVELDFLSLLGCVDPPTDDELVQVWPQVVTDLGKKSKRASAVMRASRIKRLRQDRLLRFAPPTNGPPTCNPITDVSSLTRTQSMDDSYWRNVSHQNNTSTDTFGDWLLGGGDLFDDPVDNDLGNLIGKGMDPILPLDEEDVLSYDSDPEEHLSSESFQEMRETSLFDHEEQVEAADDDHMFYDGHRAHVAELVVKHQVPVDEPLQDTLNCTWTLTWHPLDQTTKPKAVNVWIEKGTMVHFGATIVEPKLMWREVYQPDLHENRKLSYTFSKPFDIRLLIVCRILDTIDTDKYPFANPQRSFVVKTCNEQEYLFEACSAQQAQEIQSQWKMVVARLASLAVVEDMENMALEFFQPMVQNQMLTTY